MDIYIFRIAFGCYTMGMFLYLAYALTRQENMARYARFFSTSAVVVHAISFVVRTVIGRGLPDHLWYMPWSNWFESFSLYAFMMALGYVWIQSKQGLPILGSLVLPLVWSLLLVAVHAPSGVAIPDVPPARHSFWMMVHVPVMMMSYAAFSHAFVLALAYLLQEQQLKSKKPSHLIFRLPSLDELDRLISYVILFGLPTLVLGIGLGALWAHQAWGRYWGWDAKETWALITGFIYMFYLLLRWGWGWRGRKIVYVSLAGFLLMIFTYFGVSHFSSLHGFLPQETESHSAQ